MAIFFIACVEHSIHNIVNVGFTAKCIRKTRKFDDYTTAHLKNSCCGWSTFIVFIFMFLLFIRYLNVSAAVEQPHCGYQSQNSMLKHSENCRPIPHCSQNSYTVKLAKICTIALVTSLYHRHKYIYLRFTDGRE